ncbi:MAG: MarR family winged helix-turn-helix transcriptional regulator [Rhodococcus sp. (in: high G+C Gram-positive bacteria)]|uniref:MarR family winged helix-turn-helix transcriptional regulator n=1 Tax=unclassified Rhodococcus (in: high G+C Gram-positive bacteria) TaxID=192944 RepID=UPI000AE33A96|nr:MULTISPECIES: MarR family winged helix-turn-helix transcriptional regulator [unclassified Rhodococcus (in: high G+C Gram-positive bacteria)]RMB77952.1 MarR family transcriptional regulator [Rhodococcus sp. SBT000017]
MDEGLADLLHRVVLLLGEAARAQLDSPDGPTYSQLRILGTLDDIAPVTQHELAQAMSVSDPAISRALQPLRETGLVDITVDPTHARRRLVRITDAGRHTFHSAGKPLQDQFRAALIEAGFPYDSYLEHTKQLADLLDGTAPGASKDQPDE